MSDENEVVFSEKKVITAEKVPQGTVFLWCSFLLNIIGSNSGRFREHQMLERWQEGWYQIILKEKFAKGSITEFAVLNCPPLPGCIILWSSRTDKIKIKNSDYWSRSLPLGFLGGQIFRSQFFHLSVTTKFTKPWGSAKQSWEHMQNHECVGWLVEALGLHQLINNNSLFSCPVVLLILQFFYK